MKSKFSLLFFIALHILFLSSPISAAFASDLISAYPDDNTVRDNVKASESTAFESTFSETYPSSRALSSLPLPHEALFSFSDEAEKKDMIILSVCADSSPLLSTICEISPDVFSGASPVLTSISDSFPDMYFGVCPVLTSISEADFASPVDTTVLKCPIIDFTPEEFTMLCCVVQCEVDYLGIEHKRLIVNTIVNRVLLKKFPNTISEVLHQKNQFPTISNYYETTFMPDEVTIRAVREVLSGECADYSNGAVYFYDPRYCGKKASAWFEEKCVYLFTVDCHRFFKDA